MFRWETRARPEFRLTAVPGRKGRAEADKRFAVMAASNVIRELPTMSEARKAAAIWALEAALRSRPSAYSEQFQPLVKGREKRQLGDHFRLRNFGVNLARLAPGAATALRQAHTRQDEFVYVVEGYPVLLTNDGEEWLSPGMCSGFPAQGRHAVLSFNLPRAGAGLRAGSPRHRRG